MRLCRGRGSIQVQRADLGGARSLYVDRELESRLDVFVDELSRQARRLPETRRVGPRHRGRLDEYDLVEIDPLAEGLNVVDDGRRELLVDQPYAGKGVARGEDHERVQPRLLEAGGIEQGEVEASAEPSREDIAGASHRLAILLETLGRERVADAVPDDRRPYRLGDLPGARLLAGLIAVDRGVASRSRELFGGLSNDHVDVRIGGTHEGGQKFGRRPDAAPVARRQKVDFDLSGGDLPTLRSDFDFELGAT